MRASADADGYFFVGDSANIIVAKNDRHRRYYSFIGTRCFCVGNAQNQILLFNPETDYWQLDGAEEYQELRLKPDQFVTAGLVIMYFETPQGSVIQTLHYSRCSCKADHHRLRVLLLARSH